ncbi:hypothetical protein M0R45_023820 [Rubus argutus]|uniref:Uncharacterized protein n=1 Tax=Rubus argutus TaxID=59490 RepID=A0AAW1WNV8_RUBAR
MNKGKYLTREGRMTVDQEMRDVQVSARPVERVQDCANAIVNGVCCGLRYLIEPAWYKVVYTWKQENLDYTGAKNVLHPESLHTPEIKTD